MACPPRCGASAAHAQGIYREAFNHAFAAHAGEEERAHRNAWAAVKRSYVKVGESGVARAAALSPGRWPNSGGFINALTQDEQIDLVALA